MTGIVHSYNGEFGFVQPLIGRPDCESVFFHRNAVCWERCRLLASVTGRLRGFL